MRYLYEVFLVSGRKEVWQTDTPCGYFSTKSKARAAIREIIRSSTDEKLEKGDFDVYEFTLNCVEFHAAGLLVQDLWG